MDFFTKINIKTQMDFVLAQTAQIEEFMFQKVAYGPTVYKIGINTNLSEQKCQI